MRGRRQRRGPTILLALSLLFSVLPHSSTFSPSLWHSSHRYSRHLHSLGPRGLPSRQSSTQLKAEKRPSRRKALLLQSLGIAAVSLSALPLPALAWKDVDKKRARNELPEDVKNYLNPLKWISGENHLPYNEPLPPAPPSGFVTKTGVVYGDFQEGEGSTPKWGQMLSVHLRGWYKVTPTSKPVFFLDTHHGADKGTPNGRLVHHGGGQFIRGLEEAFHTMKKGGLRRVVVPKDLGYEVREFQEPLPLWSARRDALLAGLDRMGADGQFIFDVELFEITNNEVEEWPIDIPIENKDAVQERREYLASQQQKVAELGKMGYVDERTIWY